MGAGLSRLNPWAATKTSVSSVVFLGMAGFILLGETASHLTQPPLCFSTKRSASWLSCNNISKVYNKLPLTT